MAYWLNSTPLVTFSNAYGSNTSTVWTGKWLFLNAAIAIVIVGRKSWRFELWSIPTGNDNGRLYSNDLYCRQFVPMFSAHTPKHCVSITKPIANQPTMVRNRSRILSIFLHLRFFINSLCHLFLFTRCTTICRCKIEETLIRVPRYRAWHSMQTYTSYINNAHYRHWLLRTRSNKSATLMQLIHSCSQIMQCREVFLPKLAEHMFGKL